MRGFYSVVQKCRIPYVLRERQRGFAALCSESHFSYMLLIDSSVLPRIHPPKYLFRAFTPTRRANERRNERRSERERGGANLIPCLSCPSLPSCRRPGRRGQVAMAAVAPHAADRSHNLLLDVAQREAEFARRAVDKGRGVENTNFDCSRFGKSMGAERRNLFHPPA